MPKLKRTLEKVTNCKKAKGRDLYKHCRHRQKHRAMPVGGKRVPIPNRVSISERPQKADGKRFGDFEMDTIVGKGNHGAIVTLIEHSTNMLFMRKLPKHLFYPKLRLLRQTTERSLRAMK